MENITYQEKIVTVCNKQNILLQVDKKTRVFNIKFKCDNNNFNFNELISFNIYKLMEKLNTDIIERIEILKAYSENEIDVLFVFKKLGAELGLSQKYMAIKTIKSRDNNNIYLISEHIDYSRENFQEGRFEPLICELAELTIFNIHLPILDLHYRFKINTNEELPIYMENYVGLMMKKIFYNLKVFIDNFKITNNV